MTMGSVRVLTATTPRWEMRHMIAHMVGRGQPQSPAGSQGKGLTFCTAKASGSRWACLRGNVPRGLTSPSHWWPEQRDWMHRQRVLRGLSDPRELIWNVFVPPVSPIQGQAEASPSCGTGSLRLTQILRPTPQLAQESTCCTAASPEPWGNPLVPGPPQPVYAGFAHIHTCAL